jgi:hypothetical protein
MTDKYKDKAKLIRSRAQQLLESKEIDSTIRQEGELFYTGSYALDLMTWNDIDMQVVFHKGVDPLEALGRIFNVLAKDPDFVEAQMICFRGSYKPKMPRGLYLGIKMDCPHLGGEWKLDVWSLAPTDFEQNRSLLDNLSSRLTPQKRDLILELKHEMMAASGRVPPMGSHLLYQALLFEGIEENEALYRRFASQGIAIS